MATKKGKSQLILYLHFHCRLDSGGENTVLLNVSEEQYVLLWRQQK